MTKRRTRRRCCRARRSPRDGVVRYPAPSARAGSRDACRDSTRQRNKIVSGEEWLMARNFQNLQKDFDRRRRRSKPRGSDNPKAADRRAGNPGVLRKVSRPPANTGNSRCLCEPGQEQPPWGGKNRILANSPPACGHQGVCRLFPGIRPPGCFNNSRGDIFGQSPRFGSSTAGFRPFRRRAGLAGHYFPGSR